MMTLHISLPDALIEFVQERVIRGDYDTANDYLRELIQDDQRRKAQEKLDSLLKEGFDSGQSTPMTAQDWDEIRRAGLPFLDDEATARQIKLDRLRKDIVVAVEAEERGEVAPLDIEAIIAEGKRRLAARASSV